MSIQCECGRISKLGRQEIESLSYLGSHLKARFAGAFGKVNQNLETEAGKHLETLWYTYISCCEDFTSKGFTYAEDTLPALSSLASRLAFKFGRSHAGIWEYNIFLGLQWESPDGGKSHRYTDYLAPSFSWASRTGAVIWHFSMQTVSIRGKCDCATVLAIQCNPSTDDLFSKVSNGFIKLRGRCARCL